jgi:hypothetical protein
MMKLKEAIDNIEGRMKFYTKDREMYDSLALILSAAEKQMENERNFRGCQDCEHEFKWSKAKEGA